MDDAMTERLLSIIDNEVEYSSRRYIYKKLSPYAAVLCLMSIGISFLFTESDDEVTIATETTTDNASQQAVIRNEKRAMLGHIDGTLKAGFSPEPQESYVGHGKYRYGVSIYGHYEYTACTDAL